DALVVRDPANHPLGLERSLVAGAAAELVVAQIDLPRLEVEVALHPVLRRIEQELRGESSRPEPLNDRQALHEIVEALGGGGPIEPRHREEPPPGEEDLPVG